MIVCGNSLHLMAAMRPASVDSIVTDPPYGLSFMGKGWDHGVPGVPFWEAALHVAKPGAHLLAFGGTRTHHRLMTAIEDAGWELRDCLMWLYGSGFPKSLDVSKAIDKRRTEDEEPRRVVCRAVRKAMDDRGLKSRDLVGHFGDCNPRLVRHWAARDTDSQPSTPTPGQWTTLLGYFPELAEHSEIVETLNGRKGDPGKAFLGADIVEKLAPLTSGLPGESMGTRFNDRRAPATEAAQAWSGYGTGLKPAWEPIVLARKPPTGTVVANVLEHGTGALNIDGCRIGKEQTYTVRSGRSDNASSFNAFGKPPGRYANPPGRFPSNVLLDEVAADQLDEQSGDTASSSAVRRNGEFQSVAKGAETAHETSGHADFGGASRFFYTGKASSSDRGRTNEHPTVKPTDLMAYLVRLVTPPGGVVLDPFSGSGSTRKAAHAEGFRCIGIELSEEYAQQSVNRSPGIQESLFRPSARPGPHVVWLDGGGHGIDGRTLWDGPES